MTSQKSGILKYFFLYDYHDVKQAEHAVKTFITLFVDKFETLLSNKYFKNKKVEIRISDADLLDALHQAKHEIEGLSHLHLVTNIFANNTLNIPKAFLDERKKVPEDCQHYTLIGNIMTANSYRQAACFTYWLTKLKPILDIAIDDCAEFTDKKINFFKTYINEYFAIYIAFGIMNSAVSKQKSKFTINSSDVEHFLHLLRYKHTQPESLALLLSIWFKSLMSDK